MQDSSIEMRLNQARQGGTVAGFALNRAKEGIDVRPLLNEGELALVNEEYDQQLQKAKEEEVRNQAEQVERRRKEQQYEEWCATLPTIGIKIVDLRQRTNSLSLASFYTDLDRHSIPTHKYGNRLWVTLEDAERYSVLSKCETKTGWSRVGRSVASGSQPLGYRRTWYGIAALYQEAQTRLKRKPTPGVAHATDDPSSLLAAVFSVNRSAKRYRDAASACYDSARHRDRNSRAACHSLARINSQKKERLYRLKDAGLTHAVRRGWLQPIAMHGNLTVYRGNGYCFHSLLSPNGWKAAETSDGEVFVEQKPRSKSEMRLKDAVATLELLPTDMDGFEKARFPERSDVSASWRSIDDEDEGFDEFDDEDEFDQIDNDDLSSFG